MSPESLEFGAMTVCEPSGPEVSQSPERVQPIKQETETTAHARMWNGQAHT